MKYFYSFVQNTLLNATSNARLIQLLAAGALMCSLQPALGWGSGHSPQTRVIFENLPLEISSKFSPTALSNAFNIWCFEPDAYKKPFNVAYIGETTFNKLTQLGITNRYELHSDKGRALSFCYLVEAFKEGNYDHVAYWTAVLSHSNGDMGAENHNPTAHYELWAWEPFQVQLEKGGSLKEMTPMLDLNWTTDASAGMATFRKWVQGHLPTDDGRDGRAALLEEMMRGCTGASMLAGVANGLLSTATKWINRHDPADRQHVWDAMAQLAGWGAVNVIRDVMAAKRLAEAGTVVEVNAALLKAYSQAKQKHIRECPLASDALFASLLRLPSNGIPAIGIVFEPTWQMDESMLGYGDRVIEAATARTLAEENLRYFTVDVRDILTNGLPSPKQMPVLILSASQLRNYEWMLKTDLDQRLKTYLDQKGKVIWIGGNSALLPVSFGHVQKAMTRSSGEWPFSTDEFGSFSLTLHGPRGVSWPVVHNMASTGGWQKPLGPYQFTDAQKNNLEPLLSLASKDKQLIIAATWSNGAYIPLYTMAPFVFSQDKMADVGQPVLDHVGRAILLETLTKLSLPNLSEPLK